MSVEPDFSVSANTERGLVDPEVLRPCLCCRSPTFLLGLPSHDDQSDADLRAMPFNEPGLQDQRVGVVDHWQPDDGGAVGLEHVDD
jgi:hypothetical protein